MRGMVHYTYTCSYAHKLGWVPVLIHSLIVDIYLFRYILVQTLGRRLTLAKINTTILIIIIITAIIAIN